MIKYIQLLICLFLSISALAQTKRALIIAVGDYPSSSGWEKIHANNDRTIIIPMLLKYGYQQRDMETLVDAQATKKNVTDALGKLCDRVSKNDFIYLHFSCHGQQMMDDNGDEEDGLDESMILYDASFWYVSGKYEGENHLRDDELGVWIDKLRIKVGNKGQVVVVLDACHSGTGNRENEEEDYIRGTSAIFAPPGYEPKSGKHQELSLRLKPHASKSPVVVFSACLSGEINYEYYDKKQKQYFGMLSYALKEIVNQSAEAKPVTAFTMELQRKMYSLVSNRIYRKQTPYMECSDLNMNMRINK